MSGKNLRVNLIANTSQFKSAMSESSNQIKLLNSEFKSAAAETDKYGNKLDATGAKKKQLTGVIEQYRVRLQAIKNEQKHWTRELERGNITETQHAQKQQELARRLNNTQAEMKRYEGQLKRINAEGKATARTYADFDRQFRQVGTTMRNVGAQAGITAGVGFMAMKRVLGDVVNEAKTFHAGMSEVQAISGATGDELGKLTNQAKQLGRDTMFSSQQASESMANLARAGFTVNEIYDSMPGLLDLAASSKLDLGTAANITSNVIRTFGFEANKAGQVADVLAKGAATANTDVQGLGESMKTAGPVAKSLGIQFESVAAATGIMADAGIAGSESGRMLRQGMLRLSKPTGEAEKLIKKMGVNVFDASGNMKSLDQVVGELQKGMKGYTGQQKAAALATIFGSESTAGWTVLLDKGSDALKNYTIDLENSEGAAKNMADVMQDNTQGAIIRMQSALSGLKIELGEKLLPLFAQGADFIGDLANKMAEWDAATIQTIAESALLVTAVLGVTTAVGALVAGIGAFMAFAGPVGLAITAGTALLGGLAAAVYKNKLETEQSNKVNLDNAKSLADQAVELEKNANTFDNLSSKAKISNSELAQLHDLNQRIARGGSSDEIAKLQYQYDKLAEKSGLSKEELEKLFGANDNIIKQSPNVEQSVSAQGNAFAKNTEEVRKYLNTLDEMTQNELTNERTVALEREKEIIKEITEQKKEQKRLDAELGLYEEANNMSVTERKTRIEEISALYRDMTVSEEEKAKLNEEQVRLLNVQSGHYREVTLEIRDQMIEKAKSIEKNEEELALIAQIDTELANIRLRRLDINEQGERGLIVLEEALATNHKTLSNLDAELEKNGKLTEEQQKQKESVTGRVEKLQEAQSYINTELELYGSVNSLVESQRHLLSESTNERIKGLEKTHEIKVAEGDIVKQLQEKQGKLVAEREQLEKNRELQGANKKEIDEQIAAIDKKINAGDGVVLQMLKELDILELVRDGIVLNGTELQSYLEGLGYSTEEAFKLAQQLSGETVKALEDGVKGAEKAGKNTGDGYDDGLASTKPKINSTSESIKNSTSETLGSTTDGEGGKSAGLQFDLGLEYAKLRSDSTSKSMMESTTNILGSTTDGEGGKKAGLLFDGGLNSTKGQNEASSTALSLAVSAILGSATDGDGGMKAGQLFNLGILGWDGQVRGSGVKVATSGRDGLASVDTSQTGTDFVDGFKNSISNGSGSVWTTAFNLGKFALSALKQSIDSHSPSEETKKEGYNFIQGFAVAIKGGTGTVIKKAAELGTQAVINLASGIKSKEKIIDTNMIRLTRNIEKATKEFNDEIQSINKKAQAEASKLEKRAQEDINLIHAKAKEAKRKLTQAEAVRIQRLEEDTADKVKKIHEKAASDVQKVEVNKSKELDKIREEELQRSKKWIDQKKQQNELSLADELAAWERVQARYEEGTKQREEADKNALRVRQEIHDQLMTLEEEAMNKIQSINDNYAAKVKEQEDLYQREHENNVNRIANFAGLFDEFVAKMDKTGQDLLNNLRSQVTGLQEWRETLESLNGRIDNKALMRDLEALGPKAAGELKALNSLSAEELQLYAALYDEKFRLAREHADDIMGEMKEDTEIRINELREAANHELEIVRAEWTVKIRKIVSTSDNELKALETTGRQAGEGLLRGLESMEPALIAKAQSIAQAIRDEIDRVLEIASPSKATYRSGAWVGDGLIGGMDARLKAIKKMAGKMGSAAMPTLDAFKSNLARYKDNFGKLSYSISTNMQALKVEHEFKQSGVEKLLLQLIDAVKNGNNNNPEPASVIHVNAGNDAESIARAVERAKRRLAFQMR